MASLTMELRAKRRWWVFAYLNTLAWFCRTFGVTPDESRVVSFIVNRGFKIEAYIAGRWKKV